MPPVLWSSEEEEEDHNHHSESPQQSEPEERETSTNGGRIRKRTTKTGQYDTERAQDKQKQSQPKKQKAINMSTEDLLAIIRTRQQAESNSHPASSRDVSIHSQRPQNNGAQGVFGIANTEHTPPYAGKASGHTHTPLKSVISDMISIFGRFQSISDTRGSLFSCGFELSLRTPNYQGPRSLAGGNTK
ncbi:hypothetical protein SISSUDRAFT_1068189 [Sistotremastrum suecicum HHB10207 ss-3]|uniref:Uncharacterized protein n=1 Tax=Sistotremastrum suecicum HHB10207 ss-3 TaxID=1314776 RepID=A0A165WDZ8_9AGAM|nr:hypothetical protein SISSUDRAFT_1068189 [Sistotremastrum suecicum HHB10207 ss-3]